MDYNEKYVLDFDISLDLKEYDKIIRTSSRNIEQSPNDIKGYLFRSIAYLYLSNFERAELDVQRIRSINPTYEVYYHQGKIIFQRGDYELALRCYELAVSMNSSSSNCFLARGKAKGILLDWKGAISDFEKAIYLDTANWSALQNLGICQMNVGQFDEALVSFNRSIDIKPNEFETYGYIAEVLDGFQRIEEAYKNCTWAVENSPTANLYATRSLLNFKLHRYKESIADADQSIRLDNSNLRAYVHRSNSLWALGFCERAIDDLITGMKLAPRYSDLYAKLADYCYDFYGTSETSICLLRTALMLDPENSAFLFSLGNYHSSWIREKNSIPEKIRPIFEMFKLDIGAYCSEEAFENKDKIAKGFYSSAFANMFSILRTDLKNLEDCVRLSIFVRNSDYLFDILENRVLFFTDVNQFPDKVSDCPLLQPINQSDLAVNLSHENVRIRSCSSIHKKDEICSSLSMWDRFANGHKGICYTLLVPKSWFIESSVYIGKIKYTNKQVYLKAESPEQVIQDGLFIKDSGYSDENEFRLAKFGTFAKSSCIKLPFDLNNHSDSIKIETIYLGAHVEEKDREKARKLTAETEINLYQIDIIQNGKLACRKLEK